MRNPSIRQLKTVAEIAASGSISQAAAKLNVSPSAVSLTLKQTEDYLGMPLFERTKRGFKPTFAGHELVLAEARIAAVLSETRDAISAIKGNRKGRLTVGVTSTAKYFAPFALAAFREAHSEVDIFLKVGNRQETIEMLGDFTLDFAIMGRPPQNLSVEKSEIGPHPHVVIASANHPKAKKKRIAASELSGETFLLREPGSGTRTLSEQILANIGATPKTGMEISSNETIKQAVMAGLGIALLSYHTVAHEVEEGRLSLLRVEGTPVVRTWYVVKLAEKRLMPVAQSLWSFLEKSGPKFFPKGLRKQRGCHLP